MNTFKKIVFQFVKHKMNYYFCCRKIIVTVLKVCSLDFLKVRTIRLLSRLFFCFCFLFLHCDL